MRKNTLFITILMILIIAQISQGRVVIEVGPVNTDERNTIPKHESRVYSTLEMRGDYIYLNSTIEEINELVNMFSKIRIRDHELTISEGEKQIKHTDDLIDYNVLFWQFNANVPKCKLTIYTNDYQALAKELKIPENIFLVSDINDFPLKSKAVKPKRKTWYGKIQFENPIGYESGHGSWVAQVTLWEKGIEGGIAITKVSNQGIIKMDFSESEIADLKAGNSWLTLTAGNSVIHAKQTDTRLPFDFLSMDKEEIKAVMVDGPQCYYGRILFEDDSPAIIDPEPWQGAQIKVNFDYAGTPEIDSEGYFKVYFAQEQYKKRKSEKVRRNIYIPDYEQKGRSTARFTFPVSELSQDKSKAGVVVIPRPVPPKQELSTVESKVGKQIPGFEKIKSADFKPERTKDKSLLVCFWDIDQRPSRQYVLELEKNKDALQNKNIKVFIVHAGTETETEVKKWISENKISFDCGIIEGKPYDTLLKWGARGLPWLVLTNEKHVIVKAGFGTDELADIK